MKTTRYFSLLLAVLLGCGQATETPTPELSPAPLDRQAIDNHIWQTVKQQNAVFDWNAAPPEVVWNALRQSDGVISIGYKPARLSGKEVEEQLGQIDPRQGEWELARQAILDLVWEIERQTNPDLRREELFVFDETALPVLNLRVTSLRTITQLRASALVRYAEPMGYEPAIDLPGQGIAGGRTESSSGCGSNNEEFGLQAGIHFTTIGPNAKASWNQPYHQISGAWANTTGTGIKVMIIDTGISQNQPAFGSGFNQGESAGRSIEKLVTLPRPTFLGFPTGPAETPNDGCGHGTSMAGVLAGPRGTVGNVVGIAYNANLVTVRASQDVLIDASREVRGVADAFVLAANRPDIRIVSLSLGRITSSSQIADAIRLANSRGKLMFCAGGTSFGWTAGWFGVIFPANMNEVQAVTGLKENGERCTDCHDGSQIDFVVMERNADGVKPVTTANQGNWPSTVGGSSVATAQVAGMATLTWAKFPTLTREQVLARLVLASSNYPNRSDRFGWGLIDAGQATDDQSL
jgi:Subtilase family